MATVESSRMEPMIPNPATTPPFAEAGGEREQREYEPSGDRALGGPGRDDADADDDLRGHKAGGE